MSEPENLAQLYQSACNHYLVTMSSACDSKSQRAFSRVMVILSSMRQASFPNPRLSETSYQ